VKVFFARDRALDQTDVDFLRVFFDVDERL
jgi:hypothetical protein